MFDHMIRFALTHRTLVVSAAALLTVWGTLLVARMPVDVLPDLNRTTVTIITECRGLTPEQVELQVTRPIETGVNGAPGVERVRSDSGIGLSLVFVVFGWGADPWRARQIVGERLDLVAGLPPDVKPVLGPLASLMGEIMYVGVSGPLVEKLAARVTATEDALAAAEGTAPDTPAGRAEVTRLAAAARTAREDLEAELMRLRTVAEWEIRPRLLAVRGVAKVGAIGGESQQMHVLADPGRLLRYGLTIDDLRRAVGDSDRNAAGGFADVRGWEFQIPVTGRTVRAEDFAESVVAVRDGVPILVRDVAEVRPGPRFKRGLAAAGRRNPDGTVTVAPAVILDVQKQPGTDTVTLTAAVRAECRTIAASINRNTEGDRRIDLADDLFLQSRFIEASVANTAEALRDGGVLVAVILTLFLLNLRTTAVTLTAIPLSLLITGVMFHVLGFTINTMTLGGLALAVGEICDDAVVDVENVFRRLRENRAAGSPLDPLTVVFRASREIRNSVVLSTLIVCFTFLPVLALPGLEGRLFTPMGLAYVASLAASLLVSLTVTPVLCRLLLPQSRAVAAEHESFAARGLKRLTAGVLSVTLRFPVPILAVTAVLCVGSAVAVSMVGVERLPKFNEGTFLAEVILRPGTSLAESDRIGSTIQRLLHDVPEVTGTSRRTGRAEVDEHVHGSYYSSIEIRLAPSARNRAAIMADLNARLARVPSAQCEIDQPISERIAHMTSGGISPVQIKVFGDDLDVLRRTADRVRAAIGKVDGVVNARVEPVVPGPEIKINIRRADAGRLGFRIAGLVGDIETLLGGHVVGQVVDGPRSWDLVAWAPPELRRDAAEIAGMTLTSPSGAVVTLDRIADVYEGWGPNLIRHEDGRRRIAVSCNVQGRDLAAVVGDIGAALARDVEPTLPAGVVVRTGGEYGAMLEASRTMAALGCLAVAAAFLLLYGHFGSAAAAVQILLTIPLCFVGAVVAVMLTTDATLEGDEAPSLWYLGDWLAARSWNIAHLVGFFSLVGIAARNGVLLVDNYVRLHREEGMPFGVALIVRGTQERMIPMAMTTLTAMLSMVPILLAPGAPGKEILHPVAVVVFGGLISTSLIGLLFSPAAFLLFGRRAVEVPDGNRPETIAPDRGET